MKLRINKLISDLGLGSRREAEEYIKQGRVKINGRRASLTDSVSENDIVLLDDMDLPVKDLIREHVALEKLESGKRRDKDQPQRKSRAQERAESQRLQHASKSAALRKTSKNNPENKRRARLLLEEAQGLTTPTVRERKPSALRREMQPLTPNKK